MYFVRKKPSMRIVTLAIVTLIAPSLYAQTCAGKLVPVQPPGLLCLSPAPVCICAGNSCDYVWGCPAENIGVAKSRTQTVDPDIPTGHKAPQLMSPVDVAATALEIRRRQLENERIQLEIERLKAEKAAAAVKKQIQPKVEPDLQYFTGGLTNGNAWRSFGPDEKAIYMSAFVSAVSVAAKLFDSESDRMRIVRMVPLGVNIEESITRVDRFYSDPTYALIPIGNAIFALGLESSGAPPADVRKYIENARTASAAMLKQ
jgi:hypothetical protein